MASPGCLNMSTRLLRFQIQISPSHLNLNQSKGKPLLTRNLWSKSIPDLAGLILFFFLLKSRFFELPQINPWWKSALCVTFSPAGLLAPSLRGNLSAGPPSLCKSIFLALKHRCYPSDWTFKVTSPKYLKVCIHPQTNGDSQHYFGRPECSKGLPIIIIFWQLESITVIQPGG